jgi:hypothetical protein
MQPVRTVLVRATVASFFCWQLGLADGAAQSDGAAPIGESWCRPADAVSLRTVEQLREVLSGTDSASVDLRRDVGITFQPSAQVALVADEALCERAVSALNARTRTPTRRRQVYLFDLGGQFAVEDPQQMAGEARMVRVFNPEWQLRGDILVY